MRAQGAVTAMTEPNANDDVDVIEAYEPHSTITYRWCVMWDNGNLEWCDDEQHARRTAMMYSDVVAGNVQVTTRFGSFIAAPAPTNPK